MAEYECSIMAEYECSIMSEYKCSIMSECECSIMAGSDKVLVQDHLAARFELKDGQNVNVQLWQDQTEII